MDALESQLVSAMRRFSTLQRRAAAENPEQPKLLSRALSELETLLEELRVVQEQMVEYRHQREHLQTELTHQYQKYWQLFDQMPQPYVVTKPDTLILEANKAAADLFNVSQRFLVGKTLSVFVCEERGRFLSDAARIAAGAPAEDLRFRLRPRERAPLEVTVRVSGDEAALRWLFQLVPLTTDQG